MRSILRQRSIRFWELDPELTCGEATALAVICHWKAGDISPSELAKHMRMPPAGISRVLRSLERNGYICRRRDPRDHRGIRIAATEKGLEQDRRSSSRIHDFWQEVFSLLSEEEVELFLQSWNRVMDSMETVFERRMESGRKEEVQH